MNAEVSIQNEIMDNVECPASSGESLSDLPVEHAETEKLLNGETNELDAFTTSPKEQQNLIAVDGISFSGDECSVNNKGSIISNSDASLSELKILVGNEAPIYTNDDIYRISPSNTLASANSIGPDVDKTKLTTTAEANSADTDISTANVLQEGEKCAASEVSGVTKTAGSLQQAYQESQNSSLYHLKWFPWNGQQTPIVTQNENGPCPLLAIANVLILARKIMIPYMQEVISGQQLVEYIGDCILAGAPKPEGHDEVILNYQQNMHDGICMIEKLQTGMDVNVKFSGCTEFEYTRECIVFDLLHITLCHGWLIDPQDEKVVKAVGGQSYNQLVEKIISSKQGGDPALEHYGLVAEEFLLSTASQLTYHGLCELNETVQEEELCVFFRNNHFSTLYKHRGELFLLVTDQGFLTEPNVIWETLVNIEGDGHFVDAEFKTAKVPQCSAPTELSAQGFSVADREGGTRSAGGKDVLAVNAQSRPDENVPSHTILSQEDRDYLIALQLQQDLQLAQVDEDFRTENRLPGVVDDHMLALQLQREEDERVEQERVMRNSVGEPALPASRQPPERPFLPGRPAGPGEGFAAQQARQGRRERENSSCCLL